MVDPEKEEEERDRAAFITWGVVTLLIVAVCIVYPIALMKAYNIKPENAGIFGDQFGALNALFSGIAFAALVATVFLQRNELRATRREMREQNETAKVSAKALSLSNRVQVYSGLLSADLELVNYHKRMLEEASDQIKEVVEERKARMEKPPATTNDAERRKREAKILEDTKHRYESAHEEHSRQYDQVTTIYSRIEESRAKLAGVGEELEAEDRAP